MDMGNDNKIRFDMESILTDPNSSQYDKMLALCLLEIRQKIATIERLIKIQLGLISTLITGLVTLATLK